LNDRKILRAIAGHNLPVRSLPAREFKDGRTRGTTKDTNHTKTDGRKLSRKLRDKEETDGSSAMIPPSSVISINLRASLARSLLSSSFSFVYFVVKSLLHFSVLNLSVADSSRGETQRGPIALS
jgi:hypothetical protein